MSIFLRNNAILGLLRRRRERDGENTAFDKHLGCPHIELLFEASQGCPWRVWVSMDQ
jgi:hypothetical protein